MSLGRVSAEARRAISVRAGNHIARPDEQDSELQGVAIGFDSRVATTTDNPGIS
jgi:hypothetical protein